MTLDAFRQPQPTLIVPQTTSGGLMLSDVLTVDCTTSEDPSDDATPTRLPIEDGADVTDHVVDQPTRLALGVVQTNHPAAILTIAAPMRARNFYEDLFRFKSTKQLLTVITSHRVYENMLLVSIPPTWNGTNGEGFVATLQFEEIRRVSTKIVDVPPTTGSAAPLKDGGAKSLKTATPIEAESFLHSLVP